MLRTLLICTATGVLGVACASAPATPAPQTAAATTASQPDCFGPPSASRLPQSGCGPGQTYGQQAVRSTGQPTAAAALQTLDPLVNH